MHGLEVWWFDGLAVWCFWVASYSPSRTRTCFVLGRFESHRLVRVGGRNRVAGIHAPERGNQAILKGPRKMGGGPLVGRPL